MKLPLDWILQEPIDMEHKEYVLLDYISKINKELENFNLYPTFQELTLHLANLNSISGKLKRIDLKNEPEDVDDEILLANIVYKELSEFESNELKEIVKISKDANNRLKDYFLIAKSIWSIVFESVLVQNTNKDFKFTKSNSTKGYLKFDYKGEQFLYKFNIKKINPKYDERKCVFTLVERGDKIKKRLTFNANLF